MWQLTAKNFYFFQSNMVEKYMFQREIRIFQKLCFMKYSKLLQKLIVYQHNFKTSKMFYSKLYVLYLSLGSVKMNTFITQGFIKLIKSESQGFYTVKKLYFKNPEHIFNRDVNKKKM